MRPDSLQPHPEGGRFQEVYRSAVTVQTGAGDARSALTHIYFELAAGEISCLHRVDADEVWNLYRGDGVRLVLWAGGEAEPEVVELSQASGAYCHVVPAGTWQAAAPLDGVVLVGCSVGPGFEFAGFEMLTADRPEAEAATANPELAPFVAP